MASVCIVTDSLAQFAEPLPEGMPVHILPLLEETPRAEGGEPAAAPLRIPSAADLRQLFLDLAARYNEIVAVLHSCHLSPLVDNAIDAAGAVRGRLPVQVIDTQTIAVGQAYLVEVAARAAAAGTPATEIERLLRGILPHVYSVFCIPGLTYLYRAGFLGQPQAIVGEMLNVLPVFTLEDGRLTPLEKVRSQRHLLDFMAEFLDEFSELHQVAIVQNEPPLLTEVKALREHAALNFPQTPFLELPLPPALAALFGPRTLAAFAIEQPQEA